MKNKILIIDDDKSILGALKMVFEEFDFDSESISDASETFEIIKKYKPDLIILDVLLSGVNGSEICKELKTNELTRNIPVLLLSAHSSVEQTARDCKAEDFLSKPFNIDALIGKVKKLIN